MHIRGAVRLHKVTWTIKMVTQGTVVTRKTTQITGYLQRTDVI